MDDRKNWENFAKIDSKWAIITDPKFKYGKWSQKEFFRTGDLEIENLFHNRCLKEISFTSALDFGCGIGRLTQALARKFKNVVGVDISNNMINEAIKLNNLKNIKYIQNKKNDLSIFNDNSFDLIYSSITLQHISNSNDIKQFLREFLRIVKPKGFIIFYLPSVKSYSYLTNFFLYLRGTLFNILSSVISEQRLFNTFRLSPYMTMNYLKSNLVLEIFKIKLIYLENPNSLNTRYFFRKK